METQPEYVFIWLGLAKLRVTTALVNTNLRGAPLTHCLKIAGCKALIFGDEMIGGEFGQQGIFRVYSISWNLHAVEWHRKLKYRG